VNSRASSRDPAVVARFGAPFDGPPNGTLDRPIGWPIDWIVPLAEPYLRGYTPLLESDASLAGYGFLAPGFGAPPRSRLAKPSARRASTPSAGFFVGFLGQPSGLAFLNSQPPECLVFCWAGPVGSALHRRLVQEPDSLVRRTAEYIRWLTHRPPRFELFPGERVVLVRHASMRDWPRRKYQHLSRNFFIETLAWLVRSALVRRLAAESGVKPAPAIPPPRPPSRPAGARPERGSQCDSLSVTLILGGWIRRTRPYHILAYYRL